MTLDWPIAARAFNDASSLAWFGLALAPAYGGPRFITAQRIAGVLALTSLAAFAALTMTDIAGTLSANAVTTMLGATSFGHIWLARATLCIAALFFLSNAGLSAALTGAQLTLLAFAGHAFARGGAWGAAGEALHVVAGGAWVGGALALALLKHDMRASAARFSRLGYVVASLTPVAGIAVLALVAGDVVPDVGTDYGWLAAAKLALFAALLALAAWNRLYALPRGNIAALRLGIFAELAVMSALSFTAATLATTSPAM